jgi:hypothetical protein
MQRFIAGERDEWMMVFKFITRTYSYGRFDRQIPLGFPAEQRVHRVPNHHS